MRAWEGLGQKVSKGVSRRSRLYKGLNQLPFWDLRVLKLKWKEEEGGISKKDGDFKGLRRILESRPPKKQAGQISRSSRSNSTVYVLLSLLFFSEMTSWLAPFQIWVWRWFLFEYSAQEKLTLSRERREEMGGQKSFYFLWTWENWNNQYWICFSWFSTFFLEEIRNSVSFERREEERRAKFTFFSRPVLSSCRPMHWALRWHHQQMRQRYFTKFNMYHNEELNEWYYSHR